MTEGTRSAGDYGELSVDELVCAMLLAKKWDMDGPRQIAITTLAQRDMSVAQKAALGIQHHIKEWAVPSLNTLVQMPGWNCRTYESFSSDQKGHFLEAHDAEILGLKTVLGLVCVRESQNNGRFKSQHQTTYVSEASYASVDYTSMIKTVFHFDVDE